MTHRIICALAIACAWQTSNAGGKCKDPPLRKWLPVSTDGAPTAQQVLHWDGRTLIALVMPFGDPARLKVTGVRFDPCNDRWQPISDRGAFELPAADPSATAAEYFYTYSHWVGDQLYVFRPRDERNGKFPGIAAVYDARADRWSSRAATNAPGPGGLWVGTHVVVWGEDPSSSSHRFDAGYIYDWATDTRTPIAKQGAPAARHSEAHVELPLGDDRVLVWGGWNNMAPIAGGAILDVVHDTWTVVATAGAPGPRSDVVAAYLGHDVIVWGGLGDVVKDAHGNARARKAFSDGARYDPVAGTWTAMSVVGAPVGRRDPIVRVEGGKLLVFGGTPGDGDIFMQTFGPIPPTPGGIYDPKTDRWTPIPTLSWKEVERTAMFGPRIDQLAIRSRQGIALFDNGSWTQLPGDEAVERRGEVSGWTGKLLFMAGGEHVAEHGVGCGGPHPGYGCDPYDVTKPVTGGQIIRLF